MSVIFCDRYPTISYIDIKVTLETFMNAINTKIKSNKAIGNEMLFFSKLTKDIKTGKELYLLTITNSVNTAYTSIVAEYDYITDMLHFTSLKYDVQDSKVINNDFFYSDFQDVSVYNTLSCPVWFLMDALYDIAQDKKGTIAIIYNYKDIIIVKEGVVKKVGGLSVFDEEGNLYVDSSKTLLNKTVNNQRPYIHRPLKYWIYDHKNISDELQDISCINKKMNRLGQFLIDMKLKGEIEKEEFNDMFTQTALVGFTDKTLIQVYKLLV